MTGSRYLVDGGGRRVLVDCGLFQGPTKLRERNWREPLFDPRELAAVVRTHAHIHHSGYLPRLCNAGITGPVLHAGRATTAFDRHWQQLAHLVRYGSTRLHSCTGSRARHGNVMQPCATSV